MPWPSARNRAPRQPLLERQPDLALPERQLLLAAFGEMPTSMQALRGERGGYRAPLGDPLSHPKRGITETRARVMGGGAAALASEPAGHARRSVAALFSIVQFLGSYRSLLECVVLGGVRIGARRSAEFGALCKGLLSREPGPVFARHLFRDHCSRRAGSLCAMTRCFVSTTPRAAVARADALAPGQTRSNLGCVPATSPRDCALVGRAAVHALDVNAYFVTRRGRSRPSRRGGARHRAPPDGARASRCRLSCSARSRKTCQIRARLDATLLELHSALEPGAAHRDRSDGRS